jgi:DNA-binding HxlR family transcriptional regulator
VRAGASGLSLLSDPLDVQVLHALGEGSRSLIDLRDAVGSPAQTTMRTRLKKLTQVGAVDRRGPDDLPASGDYALTRTGRELLDVAKVVQAWLGEAPANPQPLGSVAAKRSLKALTEAWSTYIVRALAARPLTLTELSKLISALNYPSLERRLTAMRFAGLVEASPSSRSGTRCASTTWLKRAVGPLIAAARWEQRHTPLTARPLGRLDIEATFLLAIPLLHLPPDLSGTCRLAVEIRSAGGEHDMAGVVVRVEDGQVVSCISRLRGEVDASVSGSAPSWLDAVIDQEPGRLELGGDTQLADGLLDRLHGALFSSRAGV